ncbi:MAG: hypothetical protein ACRDY0_09390 [Acidimicrobiales bacterium]
MSEIDEIDHKEGWGQMAAFLEIEVGFENGGRLLERLDRMVEKGQVTAEEAGRLRAAETDGDFDAAVVAIRGRHAGVRLSAAVDAGQMSQAEDDANLERIRRGEHPRGLRAHVARLAPRR